MWVDGIHLSLLAVGMPTPVRFRSMCSSPHSCCFVENSEQREIQSLFSGHQLLLLGSSFCDAAESTVAGRRSYQRHTTRPGWVTGAVQQTSNGWRLDVSRQQMPQWKRGHIRGRP
ncbi:hypothetical protein TGPRC2_308075 [Toxoplasma gondii TgCatPRC2]|uniref:Uncharacterized protein n=1 Tax=Toxoplasma gondii TgCatPRC2 TaxID=1130821 RepID=A0A151H5L3_TOXGO|nr:hypothetical protein TGPRC2_308075 [Toxoplasma gondii TgCatPRC2]